MSIIAHLARGGRYRWLVCALLFLATTINYVDRQILALLKPILDDQLGGTNQQFGLVNSAFHFQAAGNVTAGYAMLFAICGSAHLVAFLANHLLAPRFEPVKIPSP